MREGGRACSEADESRQQSRECGRRDPQRDKAAAQVGGDVALLQHTGGLEGHHGGGSGHGGLAAIGI